VSTETLKEKTAKGIAWGAVNNGTVQLLNLVFGIVLARRLSESDYGILALLTIFTTLAGCIQAAGFSQALANLKPPTLRDYSAVFWFNTLAGFSMYILLYIAAPLIAAFFDLPELTNVARLTFLCIPVSALGIVPNAKLWIELRNRELAIAAILSLALSGCVGIWLAYHGYGYWSLAWQQLLFISLSSIIKWCFTRWRPLLLIDMSPIRSMFRFSSKLLLTNMLTVTSQHVLTFIFGKLFPIGVVGQFNQANKWNTMGSSFISNTMQQVAQPVLTQASVGAEAVPARTETVPARTGSEPAQDNVESPLQRQQRVFRKMLRFTSFVVFPLMLGLALVAREFIVLTITDRWLPCVPLLQMLCIGGAFMPLHTLYQNFIISCGRSDIYLRCIALMIVLQIVVTLSLSSFGIMVMVAAFSALNVLFTLCWHFALRRVTPFPLLSALKDTMPFFIVALLVMATTYFLTVQLSSLNSHLSSLNSQLLTLLLSRILIAAALYVGLMKLLRSKTLEECIKFRL